MRSRETPNSSWLQFEKQVVQMFSLMGFSADHDTYIAGRQTDILLRSSEEHVGAILIECKYHGARGEQLTIGVKEVEDFAARVLRLRSSGDVNAGYLVTNFGFTQHAKGAMTGRPESKFVFLRTYDELLRRLVDFDPYLRRFLSEYEASRLSVEFEAPEILLTEQTFVDKVNEPASETEALFAANRIEPLPVRIPWNSILSSFLNDSKLNVLVVLGDYGAGKTTLSMNSVYSLAKLATRTGSTHRIPCYIPLKYFNDVTGAKSLVTKFLLDDVGARSADANAFDYMNKGGHLVVVLDGFDEMAKRVSRRTLRDLFNEVFSLAATDAKIILTGRPGYFSDSTELLETIQAAGVKTVGEKISRSIGVKQLGLPPNVLLTTIAPFSPPQVESFLRNKFKQSPFSTSRAKVSRTLKWIRSTYNLTELAARPILLEMISNSIDSVKDVSILHASDLYTRYTNLWLEIEEEKGSFRTLVTSESRLLFTLVIAWKLLETGQESLHHSVITQLVGNFFGIDEADDLDHYSTDAQTCSFLSRDSKGSYSFVHQSFMEYFCARSLAIGDNRRHDLLRAVLSPSSMLVTIEDLERELPNAIYFLEGIVGAPISPRYWRNIGDETIVALMGYVQQDEDFEQTYLFDDLGAGTAKLNEIDEVIDIARSTTAWLVEILVLLRDEYPNDSALKDLQNLVSSRPYSPVETASRVGLDKIRV